MNQIAELVTLKRYAEMRKETFNRKKMPWFCGISCRGDWRVGELVDLEYAYAKLKDENGNEFRIPSGHLCYFVNENESQ